MQHIQRKSIVDTVVDQMREHITDGTWSIGDRLPTEAELSAALGVSRPSIREAVRSLVQLGLLETRQGAGTYVIADDATQVALRRALHEADSREVIEVRQALDVLAATLAAQKRTDADLTALRASLRARKAAITQGNVAEFTQHDVDFHIGIARASGNQLLSDIYASFDISLKESVADVSCLAPGSDPDRPDMHDTVLQAIADQDEERAGRAALGVLEQQERLLDDRA